MREMGDRVAAVRQIAIAKRGVTPKLTRARYLAAVERARPPKAFLADWKRGSMEGFLFPALYEFTQYTNGNELVADQLAAFRKNFAHVNLALRALEEPDAVRRAEDRLDDREGDGRAERAQARGGGDLQPAPPEDAARDRRDDPLRPEHPGTESLTKAAIASDNPYNSRRFPGLPPTPIANPGLASIKAAAHPARGRLPLLRPHPGHEAALLHGQRERVPAQGLRVRLRLQLRGWPSRSSHELTR